MEAFSLKIEIGRLDESCISNPKSEMSNRTLARRDAVQFKISDFGFEVQDSCNFHFLLRSAVLCC